MPTKKKAIVRSAKNKRVSAATKKKDGTTSQRSRVLIIIASLAGLLILTVGTWWLFEGGKTMSIQKSMETYLEDKYSKDFIVGKPKLTGSGLGVTGSWRAEAHPADDKSLVFRVGRDQVDESRFFDTHTGVVWEHEERPRVETILKELYGTQVPVFSLSTNISMKRNEPNPIRGTVPDIDSTIQKYSDSFYYGLTVKFTAAPLSESDRLDYQEKFKRVAEYVENRGAKLSALRFAINLTGEDGGYMCDTGYYYPDTDLNNTAATCFYKKISGKAW